MSAEESRRKPLGRGLSALFGESAGEQASGAGALRSARPIPVAQIHPGRFQPRRHFPENELAELAQSIRAQGVLQPILVRRDSQGPGAYELIAGERRWRAAQLAQLHEIPAVVHDLSDREALELALVENLQRENLTPLEEARAYQRLAGDFGHTQARIAEALGKSRSHVANMIRLLDLPDEVKRWLDEGGLTAGHARALITAADPAALARRIVEGGLSVRQAEALARTTRPRGGRRQGGSKAGYLRDADTLALERRLSAELGLNVTLQHKKGGQSGTLVIQYQTLDQLDDVLARLSRNPGALPQET